MCCVCLGNFSSCYSQLFEGCCLICVSLMQVKESLRDDPRYKSVKHEDRELLFNEYISELKAVEHAAERETRAKREEQVLGG